MCFWWASFILTVDNDDDEKERTMAKGKRFIFSVWDLVGKGAAEVVDEEDTDCGDTKVT